MGDLPHRELGAFVLGGPGVHVIDEPGKITLANRPGPFHYAIATLVPAGTLALWWFLREDAFWVGAGAFVLLGLPSSLVAFNRQKWEVTRRELRLSKARGGAGRSWSVPADARVRVEARHDPSDPQWPVHQVLVDAEGGPLAIAESLDAAAARAFAERVARATGIPLA